MEFIGASDGFWGFEGPSGRKAANQRRQGDSGEEIAGHELLIQTGNDQKEGIDLENLNALVIWRRKSVIERRGAAEGFGIASFPLSFVIAASSTEDKDRNSQRLWTVSNTCSGSG